MAILSESELGLQEYIDFLSKYCRKYGLKEEGLTANEKKTQIACFNSLQSVISNTSIKYNGCNLKQCNEYTYSGTIFCSNGSMKSQQLI